jgi:hypothetical protein
LIKIDRHIGGHADANDSDLRRSERIEAGGGREAIGLISRSVDEGGQPFDLVLLDWDQRNWSVKSLEQFKNEVFERSTKVIAATAAAAAAGPDPGLRAAAAAWVAKTPAELAAADASEEASDRLAEKMREAIAQDIDGLVEAQGLKGLLAQPVIDAVRLEAQAAVL